MNGSLCDDTHMNHFHAGFSDELHDIMSKEAASRADKAKEALRSPEGKRMAAKAGRIAGSGAKGALYGALFHKLVDPDISAGTALRSGVGVTAGGHVGSALGKQVGIKSNKGKLMAGLVGSALGLRMARKKHPKKSDRELLEMALKKEGGDAVATASGPQNPSRGLSGPPTPSLGQRWGQAKSLAGNISSAAQKGFKGVQQKQQLAQSNQASRSRLQGFMDRKKTQSAPKAGGGLNLQGKKWDFLSKASPTSAGGGPATPKPQSMGKKIKGTLERREGPSGKMLSKAMRY